MKRLFYTCLLLAGITSTQVSAATVTYRFTASIDHLTPALQDKFSINDVLVGRFDVESIGVQKSLRWEYQASNLSVTIGNDYVLTGTSGDMYVSYNRSGGIYVGFDNSSSPNLFGEPVGGSLPDFFSIHLNWASGWPSNSGILPTIVPFDTWNLDTSGISFPRDPESLSFNVTSMSVVPIPATVWLFGSALLGLTGLRRKNKTKIIG